MARLTSRNALRFRGRPVSATAPAGGETWAWTGTTWVPSAAAAPGAHASTHATGGADELTSAMVLEAQAKRLRETAGPTSLALGAVPDGTFLRRSGTTIVGSSGAATSGIAQGRLSTSAPPSWFVPSSTTLYYRPYAGNQVSVFNGTSWDALTIPDAGATIGTGGLATNTVYDVFGYSAAGTLTLELLAWTSSTVRATALVIQDGVHVKGGATTRRYLGTIRTIDAGAGVVNFSDNYARRFVWNASNRVRQSLEIRASAASWTYATLGVWRQANADAALKVEYVVGLSDQIDVIDAEILTLVKGSLAGANFAGSVGMGYDSTAVNGANVFGMTPYGSDWYVPTSARLLLPQPPEGYHYLTWLEYVFAGSADTATFLGATGGSYPYAYGLTGSMPT